MKLSIPQPPFWFIVFLQIIFFIFIIFLGLSNLPAIFTFIFIIFQIIIIAIGFNFIKIKNHKKIFYILSEIEIFIYLLSLIIVIPEVTFSLEEVPVTVIISLSVILISAESIFLTYYIFKEKAIKKILFILASSTSIIVFFIVAFVAMEGLPAFEENGPIEFLTGTDFNQFYVPSFSETVTLTTYIEPSDFRITILYDPFYIPLNSYQNNSITIKNNGANIDNFNISINANTSFQFSLQNKSITIKPGETKTVNFTVYANNKTDEDVNVIVKSEKTSREKIHTIHVIVSSTGLSLTPNHITLFDQAQCCSILTAPLQITNIGNKSETFILQIRSPKNFIPSINEESSLNWAEEKENNERIREIELSFNPKQTRRITVKPNFALNLVEGTYFLDVYIFSKDNPSIYSTANITYKYSENQVISVDEQEKQILEIEKAIFRININDVELGKENVTFSTNIIKGEAEILLLSEGNIILEGENSKKIMVEDLNISSITLTVDPLTDSSEEIRLLLSMDMPGTQPKIVAFPFIIATLLTTIISVLIAAPLGIGIAIFLAEFTPRKIRVILKPMYDLLAGIPSVLYGLWGAFTLAPLLVNSVYPLIANSIGSIFPFFSETRHMGEGIFTASIVLSIMIIPIVITLSEDAIRSVKKSLKEGSLALGSTRWQTMRHVILPEAKSGIISSVILGTGRAIGETMAVLMVMSTVVNVPNSIFDRGMTMTGIIANNFDYALESPLTKHGLMAIGLLLFIMVFFLNIIIARFQHKRIEKNENSNEKYFFKNIFKKIKSFSKEDKDKNNENLIEKKSSTKKFTILDIQQPVKSDEKKFTIVDEHLSKIEEKSITQKTNISNSNKRKKIKFEKNVIRKSLMKQKIILSLLFFIVVLISFTVLFIIGDIVLNGGTSISPELFFEREIAGGKEGGFLNAIVGSLYLVSLALIIAAPLSIGSAIYVQEYAKKDNIFTRIILFTSDTLASTPSIIFGAFGYLFFVSFLGFNFSLIAGGFTLAIMIIPLMLRSSIEAIKAIPRNFQEGALALGATKWQSIRSVILPPAMSGIISGIIISVGRAIGETAAVLLTAGYSSFIPNSLLHGAASMPNLIWLYYDNSKRVPILGEKVYVAAAVLIIIVLVLNGIARLFSYHQSKLMKE